MTWRRLTRAEADAEARAAWLQQRLDEQETQRILLELIAEQEADQAARLEASRPMLHGRTSAQLLDVLYDGYWSGLPILPCDRIDVIQAVIDEIGRRREATAHERIRLRALDRKS